MLHDFSCFHFELHATNKNSHRLVVWWRTTKATKICSMWSAEEVYPSATQTPTDQEDQTGKQNRSIFPWSSGILFLFYRYQVTRILIMKRPWNQTATAPLDQQTTWTSILKLVEKLLSYVISQSVCFHFFSEFLWCLKPCTLSRIEWEW